MENYSSLSRFHYYFFANIESVRHHDETPETEKFSILWSRTSMAVKKNDKKRKFNDETKFYYTHENL
jgi:hypothetical protein